MALQLKRYAEGGGIAPQGATITHNDLKGLCWCGTKIEETSDAGLDEVVGAPTVNQDNHSMMGDGVVETKCI